jgi:hypothetical protein
MLCTCQVRLLVLAVCLVPKLVSNIIEDSFLGNGVLFDYLHNCGGDPNMQGSAQRIIPRHPRFTPPSNVLESGTGNPC